MSVRLSASVLIAAAIALAPAESRAQTIDPGVVFRVFLADGRALPSYGEYAVVADRVVFVLPVGDPLRKVELQLMSVPASAVDLARTSRYAESVRARRYAELRGPAEYSAIAAEVTVTLAEVEKETDPKKRLAMAMEARSHLMAWPAAHYGFHAAEIRDLAGLFDDVVATLGAAAGEPRFSMALMTSGPTAEFERPLPTLTLRDSIQLALAAASATDVVTDRAAVLGAAFAIASDEPASEDLRLEISRRLEAERMAEASYAQLVSDLTTGADTAMRRGDVAAVAALRARLEERDRALGSLRPQEMRALAGRLDAMLERTQIFRLALDHWAAMRRNLLGYERRIRPVLTGLDGLNPILRGIRDMSGPEFSRLVHASVRLKTLTAELEAVRPPADLAAIHSTFMSALFMARQACERRGQAVIAPNLAVARDASAAAAGTLLLLAQAREDLVRQLFPPKFQ